MSFIPQIKGVGESKWTGNGLRFATAGEKPSTTASTSRADGQVARKGLENRRAVEV